MKSGFVLLYLMLVFSQVIAQDSDSSVQWYKRYFEQKKTKSPDPTPLLEKTLQTASETHDNPGEIRALQDLGLVNITRTHDYEQALGYLIKAYTLGDSLRLTQQQIFTCLAIARVFDEVGNYYISADYLQQASELSKSGDEPEVQIMVLNELGHINMLMDRIPQAFGYYEQVIENKNLIVNPAVEAEALFNIGHLYQLQHDNAKALDYQKKALVLYRSVHDKKNEAVTLSSIGGIYAAMKNDAKALANHEAALEIRQALHDKKGIAESANMLGAFFYRQKNYKKSIANLGTALRAGQESQDQEQLSKTYEYLSLCFKATGKFKEALANKELLIAMNDFIAHEKNEQRLLEVQNRYAIGKKQIAIEKLELDRTRREKELSDATKIRNGLLVLISMGVLIVLLVLYLYINKRKSNALLSAANKIVSQQNTELTDLNATKDKFFSIIGHDLKGPLNSLTSFSNLLTNHLESLTQDEIKMLSADLDKQLKNLFALLENLLEWSRSQTGAIEFTPVKFDLASILEENKELLRGQAANKQITLSSSGEKTLVVSAHQHSVRTVIRNLLSNSIKFTPPGGTIALSLQKTGNHALVSVTDTGVGMSPETIQKLFRIDTKHSTKGTANEKGTGLGLILCKEFVEKNGGKIKVVSELNKGSVFSFTIPLSVG